MQKFLHRPFVFKTLAVFTTFLLTLIALELGFRTYYSLSHNSSWLNVGYDIASQARNSFSFSTNDCPFEEQIVLDPDLAYVWNKDSSCLKDRVINKLGLEGEEFPDIKKPDDFYVLLLGGSVAHQLGGYPYLKEELQKIYPKKKIHLLVGAHGSWKIHQNFTLLARYIKQMDLVIMLNGFNEMIKLMNPDYRLELPTIEYSTVLTKKSSLSVYLMSLFYKELDQWEKNHLMHFWSSGAMLIKRTRLSVLDTIQHSKVKKPLEDRYLLDPTMDRAQKFAYNVSQVKHYYHLSYLISQNDHVPFYAFLQPVPALKKDLNDKEKLIVNGIKYLSVDEYRTTYHGLSETLLEMKKEKFPIYSLIDIFSKIKEQRYSDHIHLNQEGYQELSSAIVQTIKKGAKI